MLSGSLVGAARTDVPGTAPSPAAEPQPTRVRVAELNAERVTKEVLIQGQLEPRRRVELRAQTGGLVTALPVDKGARLSAGEVLVELALEDREAQIARAEAEVASRRLDLSASEKLGSKGMQARTQVKAAQAALAAAEAELERLRIDLAHTRIRAPFDGLVEARMVELGRIGKSSASASPRRRQDERLARARGLVKAQASVVRTSLKRRSALRRGLGGDLRRGGQA